MIGVIAKDTQHWAVHEFFELFKTPWEFYDSSRNYDVLIVNDPESDIPEAPLTLFFTREPRDAGGKNRIPAGKTAILKTGGTEFTINTGCAFFPGADKHLLEIKETGAPASIEKFVNGRRLINIGYDLFDEVEFLLSQGQPIEFAQTPALEIHIALIRKWIIQSGVALVEIPPVPYGFGATACLTHDVDFLEIKDHLMTRSMIGFLFRALFPVSTRGLTRKQGMSRLAKNWRALASLPAVFRGRTKDLWLDVERYMSIENGLPATYFFLPFKNHAGEPSPEKPPSIRAAKYDLDRHKELIATVLANGNEVGLHGIDAWLHSGKAKIERSIINDVTGRNCGGTRMHWLYFSEKSPVALQEAGFNYDSSLGFNGAVGFKSGTTQVFRLPGTKIFELPLNIMDTTLFRRNRLTETEALYLCRSILEKVSTYGGVLTINWHTRSLSPERNWDDFYSALLESVRKLNPWFASGQQAVDWFRMRRDLQFKQVVLEGNKLEIKLAALPNQDNLPPHILRVHLPSNGKSRPARHKDLPVRLESKYEVEL